MAYSKSYPLITVLFLTFLAIIQCINFDKHHDYEAMENIMISVNKKCPEITRLYDLPMDDSFDVPATTVNGRKLKVIEFARKPGKHIPGKIFCYFPSFLLFIFMTVPYNCVLTHIQTVG